MPTTRTVTTASSVWTFDLEARTYTRVPRVQGAAHPNVSYVDDVAAYDRVETLGDRVIVWHPNGSYLVTGTVESNVVAVAP